MARGNQRDKAREKNQKAQGDSAKKQTGDPKKRLEELSGESGFFIKASERVESQAKQAAAAAAAEGGAAPEPTKKK
ncbi:hypothetical protein QFC20_005671 [Naganishia adeliensis]|uniref:Uncharacterized protein n=1 Tax=Naganishia adeliensis TaxID=92952 RepID=A0ACC2VKJ4_9TREE|nr:hypothetical protein QFC20_005671 [Naganishia adeliensis]